MNYTDTGPVLLLLLIASETQVFSVGGHAVRTQVSPARWGLPTILHAVSAESLTLYDWLLSSMVSDVSADDSEDYSVSSV